MSSTFADVLRQLRRRSALSQAALAQSAGMSASAISALERGERTRPYPHTVRALAQALNLADPERQALINAASGDAMPVRPAEPPTSQVLLTSFVGRQDLIALTTQLLGRERLITLVGLGGIGKSRIAVEVTGRTAELFADHWSVDVDSSDERTSVEQLLAVALGLRDPAAEQRLDALTRAIGRRRSLLVLDGCERRPVDCAALAAHLLAACPGLVVLVTSQRPLVMQGEVILAVPPLEVPAAEDPCVGRTESVRLFIERTRLAAPTVEFGEEELADVAELCRRLDGIPLAIELAAARTRMLPVGEMLLRMQDRFALLDGAADQPARKGALRAGLKWSVELLTRDESDLFSRLSVFVGSFSLDAVETGPGRDLPDVLALMAKLVDASLVVAEVVHGRRARFRLLDTVRAYASELLLQGPHEAHARQAHAEHYLLLAEQCAPELQGPEQARALRHLDAEHENLTVALSHWATVPGPELVRLVAALTSYWVRRGRALEGQHWLGQVFSTSAREVIPLPVFEADCDLCWITGDMAAQRLAARRYLERATEDGDTVHQARATLYLSYSIRADPLLADVTWQALLAEATTLAQHAGDAWTLALVLNDTAAGKVVEDMAAGRGRQCGACLPQLREAVRLARSTGDLHLVALVLDSLALAEACAGHTDEAMSHWAQCLRDLGEVLPPAIATTCVEGLALLAQLACRPADCLVLLAASRAHRERHAAPAHSLWNSVLANTAGAARAALPAEAIATAARIGAGLTWAQAVDLALLQGAKPAGGPQAAPRTS